MKFATLFFWGSVLALLGNLSADQIRVPEDHPTIQAGIDAAADGDTVLVADSVYFENIRFNGKAITVASYFFVDGDTAHIAATVINGSQPSHPDSGSVVYFTSGEDTNSVITGFTLTGGSGTSFTGNRKAGGAVFSYFSSPRISSNYIENNSVISETESARGGGVYTGPTGSHETIILENNLIRLNSAEGTNGNTFGGGICVSSNGKILRNKIMRNSVIYSGNSTGDQQWSFGGGISCLNQTTFRAVEIKGNIIAENRSISSDGAYAGGVDLIWTNSIFSKNEIRNNVVIGVNGHYGAGMRFLFSNSSSVIEDNLFSFNRFEPVAEGWGGGILLVGTEDLTITGNHFEGNEGFSGGAIQNLNASGTIIHNNKFIRNNSLAGGGITDRGALGTHISANRFIGNFAINGGGAVLVLGSQSKIINNLITGNSGELGGGVAAVNSVFKNAAPLGKLGELINQNDLRNSGSYQPFKEENHFRNGNKILQNAAVELINNTITANLASRGGGLYNELSSTVVMNTVLWGDSAASDAEIGIDGGAVYVHYSNVAGGWDGLYNIDDDPLFRDVEGFHLNEKSPCIGAGIDSMQIEGTWYFAPATDGEGNPRPNPDSCKPDIGYWESPDLECPPVSIKSVPTVANPRYYRLFQNYPNPFNPGTSIKFSIPQSGFITLKIFNAAGERVANLISGNLPAGDYQYSWNAVNLSSGLYFYRLEAASFSQTRKMLLVR